MKINTKEPLFPEEILRELPLTYRHLAHLDTDGFKENYTDYRFSVSASHRSKAYIGAGTYKPLDAIVIQDLFPKHG